MFINRKGSGLKRRSLAWVLTCVLLGSTSNYMYADAPVSLSEKAPKMVSSVPAASRDNSLPSNETQNAQMKKMGMPTDQPARIAPSGKEVNKKSGPLGAKTTVLNKIYQVAYAKNEFKPSTTKDLIVSATQGVVDGPVSTAGYGGTPLTSVVPEPLKLWKTEEKQLVGADLDGDGQEEIVNIGLIGTPKSVVKGVEAYVTSYANMTGASKNTPTISQKFIIKEPRYGSFIYNTDQFKATAGDFDGDGKDEVAIMLKDDIYFFKFTMTSMTRINQDTRGKLIKQSLVDMRALDVNKDGYKELVTTTMTSSGDSFLTIFDGFDLNQPTQIIPLTHEEGKIQNPTVAMGDILGENTDVIVIGGYINKTVDKKIEKSPVITYVRYLPDSESYSTELERIFSIVKKTSDNKQDTDFQAVQNNYQVDCAVLDTPIPGKPKASIIFGGFVFRYNPEEGKLEKRLIESATNNSKLKPNIAHISDSNITNVHAQGDKVTILGTYAGNFDGNANGKEQVLMLHKSEWYGKTYLYVTTCQTGGDGKLFTSASEMWRSGDSKNPYHYMAISPAYVLPKGIKLELIPEKNVFAFSNPTIAAVLGATPYYKELEAQYLDSGSLGNVGTTYGVSKTTGTSKGNGIETKVGVSFGAMFEFDLIGIHNSQKVETTIENAFSSMWTKSKSVEKSFSFTNGYSNDSVAAMVVPYDIYFYKLTEQDPKTGKMVSHEITVEVPYEPQMTIMPIAEYNEAVKGMKQVPQITPDVLKHTVGDPRTYPSSSGQLAAGAKVLQYGKNDDASWINSGTGNNIVEQSITSTEGSDRTFEYSLSVELAFNFEFEIITWGGYASVGYNRVATVSSSEATLRKGSVASVPSQFSRYQFSWALVSYNYEATVNGEKVKFPVVNYIVKPNGEFPPRVPEKLSATLQVPTGTLLKWSPAIGAATYKVLRSDTQNGTYEEIAKLTSTQVQYMDTTALSGKTYYYKVLSINSKEGVPTAALEVKGLTVSALSMVKQPKLQYDEGDLLDLSPMLVALKMSDNTIRQVAYNDFAQNALKTDLKDKTALAVDKSGSPLVITLGDLTLKTDPLAVYAKDQFDFSADAQFTVDGKSNPSQLLANKPLQATAKLVNKTDVQQDLLVILVLYNEKGGMDKYVSATVRVPARSTVSSQNLRVDLPQNVTGYSASLLVWDGTSLETTNLNPKAKTMTFPLLPSMGASVKW